MVERISEATQTCQPTSAEDVRGTHGLPARTTDNYRRALAYRIAPARHANHNWSPSENMNPSTDRLPQFRVAVNARCGRACFFCRPSGEAVATAGSAELTVDDLVIVATTVRESGVRSVKITGGDPALYGPLEEAVLRLRSEAGFEQVELISRHPRIAVRAAGLADAGVTQFNLSIDTLRPELHKELCGIDDLPQILGALDACLATGVPCKVNSVVMGGINDEEIADLIEFCIDRGVNQLKLLDMIKDLDRGAESFVRRLAIRRGNLLADLYVGLDHVAERLRITAVREEIRVQGSLGHPMTVFTLPPGLKVILKDSRAGAWYGSICDGCPLFPCHDALMALRLTADLRLQFCLLREDVTVPLANLVHANPRELRRTISNALAVYAGAKFSHGSVTPRKPLEMTAV